MLAGVCKVINKNYYMKILIYVLLLSSLTLFCTNRQPETRKFPEGLLYSDTTMHQLAQILDSLNLKFKVCDLNKTYNSHYQGKAHYFRLSSADLKAARKAMESNISLEEFMKKFPNLTLDKDLLIVRHKYMDYDGKKVVKFQTVDLHGRNGHDLHLDPEKLKNGLPGKWLYRHVKHQDYDEEFIFGFYLESEPVSKTLPEKYARMVQYSECLIDTNTEVFISKNRNSYYSYKREKPAKITAFIDYINKETNKPVYEEADHDTRTGKMQKWDSARFTVIDNKLAKQAKFKQLLNDAVAQSLNEGSDDEFEEYVSRYYSKKTALELKRSRRVMGFCSMDDGPIRHAMNIAVLSAEALSWETFLRSHLDIMNDKFVRMSDGSYAQEGRKTYIRELEELDINVNDLLLGISFGIENPSKNHYFGHIGRLGRALTETKNPQAIETLMLEIIKDKNLDDYNRILVYFLYLNYIDHLIEEAHKKHNKQKLQLAVNELPAYLSTQISIR